VQLAEISHRCENSLQDLDSLLGKAERPGILDRVALGMDNTIPALRARITTNMTMLNGFLEWWVTSQILSWGANVDLENARTPGVLCRGKEPQWELDLITHYTSTFQAICCPILTIDYSCSHAETQRGIARLLKFQAGRRYSTASIGSVASFAGSLTSKTAWKQLCRDLYDRGVTPDLLKAKKPQILGLFESGGTADSLVTVRDNDAVHPTAIATNGNTALTTTSETSDRDIRDRVLPHGTVADLLSQRELEKILLASEKDQHDVIESLLQSSLWRTSREPPTKAPSRLKDQLSSVMHRSALLMMLSSAHDGDASHMELLIVQQNLLSTDHGHESGKKPQAIGSYPGLALCLAAERGHTEIAKVLLDRGVSFNNPCGPGAAKSPLHRHVAAGTRNLLASCLTRPTQVMQLTELIGKDTPHSTLLAFISTRRLEYC